jgi:hypothetical protein
VSVVSPSAGALEYAARRYYGPGRGEHTAGIVENLSKKIRGSFRTAEDAQEVEVRFRET